MEGHYTFAGALLNIHDERWQKFGTGAVVAICVLLLGILASSKLKNASARSAYIVPSRGFSLVGMFDFVVESFVKYHDSILGKENRRYASFTGSLFIFLLCTNMLGVIPGMVAATTTAGISLACALVVLIYFNYLGIRAQGFVHYVKHFCGPVWWLAWLMFPLEVLSIIMLRPMVLTLRIHWNMTADHIVLGIFNGFGPLVGVPFYLLGTFVSFLQAFIFTTLTMVYILLAIQHEEEH